MRAEAKKLGVRCIGLADMMRETGMVESVRIDCGKYESRFPDGSPGWWGRRPVTVVRLLFDGAHFPFYQAVVLFEGERFVLAAGVMTWSRQ